MKGKQQLNKQTKTRVARVYKEESVQNLPFKI